MDSRWPALLLLTCVAAACGRSSRHDAQRDPGSGGLGAVGGKGESGGTGGRSAAGGSAGGSVGTAGSSGTEAGAAGSPENPELGSVALDGTPFYTRVQRLTASQWEHAVTDILRFAEPQGLSQGFVPVVRGVTDFDNNEKVLYVDTTNFMDFETGAEAAAALATGSDEALAALYDSNDPPGFVRTLGRRAFRRPLTEAEEAAYGAIFARGEELYGAGFAQGAALVIRAMLESPHFLYRTELGPAGDPLNGYELASKLSFWLLDTTPSDALLDAAAAGALDTDEGLEATAREMLEAPAAVEVMRDFHRQALGLDFYATLSKSDVAEFDAAVVPELEPVATAFFDRIFEANFGLREIFTSKDAYVGPGLAPFYGVTVTSALERISLDASRSGYFMQAPFLMLWGNGVQSNPIGRGLSLHRMLCGELPPPPPGLPPPTTPPAEAQTTREAVTAATGACGAGCHTLFEPLGFALENFDGLGRKRSEDNGKPVDTTGSYAFAEGVRQFADGTELMSIMADSTQTHICYSKNVAGYALGRDMAPDDRRLLEGLGQVSLSNSLRELALALVRDPAFRSRPEVAP